MPVAFSNSAFAYLAAKSDDFGPAVAMILTSVHASAASARGRPVRAVAQASAKTATVRARGACIVIVRPPVECGPIPGEGPG